jgi:hypothetical protein
MGRLRLSYETGGSKPRRGTAALVQQSICQKLPFSSSAVVCSYFLVLRRAAYATCGTCARGMRSSLESGPVPVKQLPPSALGTLGRRIKAPNTESCLYLTGTRSPASPARAQCPVAVVLYAPTLRQQLPYLYKLHTHYQYSNSKASERSRPSRLDCRPDSAQ